MTAIGTIGTINGRLVAGPTDSGTHLQIIEGGDSGIGKDHPAACADDLLTAAGCAELIGPGDFASGQGLQNEVLQKGCLLSHIDEGADWIIRMTSDNGMGQGIIRIVKQLYNSWGWFSGARKANDPALRIHSPAVTLILLTTMERLCTAFQTSQVEGGFLNRQLFAAASPYLGYREPQYSRRDIPKGLIDELVQIRKWAFNGQPGPLPASIGQVVRPTRSLLWVPGAKADCEQFRAEIDAERDPVRFTLNRRVVENAIRVAANITCGRASATVSVEDMEWGREFALASLATLFRIAENIREDVSYGQLHALVSAWAAAKGTFTGRDVSRKFDRNLKYKAQLQDVLDQLRNDEGRLEIVLAARHDSTKYRWIPD